MRNLSLRRTLAFFVFCLFLNSNLSSFATENVNNQSESTQLAQAAPKPEWVKEDFPVSTSLEAKEQAEQFGWWPTDARPAPYKDPERSGYWWWPDVPGIARPWGNRGYIYVMKIIYDYKGAEGDFKPSLIIKGIKKNVKIYFNYDKSFLRDDAIAVLKKALVTLRNYPETDILVTGNCDTRGSEQYNQKLGEERALSVRKFLLDNGLPEKRIRMVSRGKLDALAPSNDIVGMQKDRNAHFLIAEVEEVMIPASQAHLFEEKKIEEKPVETLEGEIRVSFKEYIIQPGDTLWKIAEREYGRGTQWKRIYEFNKEFIKDPNKPRKGAKIRIPIE
jgi:outer membrane protein OmpA-like peptidoglycan-associated protein